MDDLQRRDEKPEGYSRRLIVRRKTVDPAALHCLAPLCLDWARKQQEERPGNCCCQTAVGEPRLRSPGPPDPGQESDENSAVKETARERKKNHKGCQNRVRNQETVRR